MSLNESIRTARKRAVEDMIWERMIKTQMKTEEDKEVTKLPDLDAKGKARNKADEEIIRHYLTYAFGNLAVRQASNAAEFPDVNINLPNRSYGSKVWDDQVEVSLNMNIFVKCLREVSRTSSNIVVNGATIVQLAEPFADLAVEYLRMTGEETTLFKKFPSALSEAKYLAFDFVSGVNFAMLHPVDKRVVQFLNTQILRTEGQNRPMEGQNRPMEGQNRQRMPNRPRVGQANPRRNP